MPPIKRRRRKQRTRITRAMLEELVLGSALGSEVGFVSAEEEREAWRRLRHILLAEHTTPGHRPVAFYRHDLGEEQAFRWRWFEEVEALERHGLLNREEEIAIERIHRELAADQLPELYERLASFARLLRTSPPGSALVRSDEFREISESLAASQNVGMRAANSQALELLATFLAREPNTPPGWPQAVVEAHRSVVGNCNAGIVFDALFAQMLTEAT